MKYAKLPAFALSLTLGAIAFFGGNARAGVADFMLIGDNNLDGTSIANLRSCSENDKNAKILLGSQFKQWIDEISQTAQQKMFRLKRCEVMGIKVVNQSGRKYRTVNDLSQRAQDLSIYEVQGDKLVLIKAFGLPGQYVVVVPEVAKSGLKLSDLNICVHPEKKDDYRRKARSVSNCHDMDQFLYVFEKYKQYPGAYQTNSALFDDKDYQSLNQKGKFNGLKVYKLIGDNLEFVK